MINLFMKNIKIMSLSKPLFIFPVFFLYHLFLAKIIPGTDGIGNVILAFIMAAAMGARVDVYDEKNGARLLHASMPVRRRDFIYAEYLTTGFMLLVALIFTFISSFIIVHFLKIGSVMNLPQMLFVFFVLAVQSLINNPISTKLGATSEKKIYFFLAILGVFFFCFWLLPLAVYNIFSGFTPLPASHPFTPIREVLDILSNPMNALILSALALLCGWLGLKLSVKIIEDKDFA